MERKQGSKKHSSSVAQTSNLLYLAVPGVLLGGATFYSIMQFFKKSSNPQTAPADTKSRNLKKNRTKSVDIKPTDKNDLPAAEAEKKELQDGTLLKKDGLFSRRVSRRSSFGKKIPNGPALRRNFVSRSSNPLTMKDPRPKMIEGSSEFDTKSETSESTNPKTRVLIKEEPKGGLLRFGDGSMYRGELKGLQRHGLGTCIYSNGSCYEGYWQDDKKHGQGEFLLVSFDGKSDDTKKLNYIKSENWDKESKDIQKAFAVSFGDSKYKDNYLYEGSLRIHDEGFEIYGYGITKGETGIVCYQNQQKDTLIDYVEFYTDGEIYSEFPVGTSGQRIQTIMKYTESGVFRVGRYYLESLKGRSFEKFVDSESENDIIIQEVGIFDEERKLLDGGSFQGNGDCQISPDWNSIESFKGGPAEITMSEGRMYIGNFWLKEDVSIFRKPGDFFNKDGTTKVQE
eukprot:GHVP01055257.1.p1 GENE.GHVP01055257.1~~GHVP01055257.1.p1  ORF type:complete len:526 (+),score=102.28 GHVP01055257.1:218-1579(+)